MRQRSGSRATSISLWSSMKKPMSSHHSSYVHFLKAKP